MLWIVLIVLIIAGVITNNYTPLKVFGKIVAWFFGIILAIHLIIPLIIALIGLLFEILDKNAHLNNKKEQEEAYLEQVKQTPLIQWACDIDGYQLYLGERPEYVYQCSTGKLIADKSSGGYTCKPSYKQVNHWKFCEHKANLNNSKYNNLLGN